MTDKVMDMVAAIERFVNPGDMVVVGAALEPMIPFAAGHEIIHTKGSVI